MTEERLAKINENAKKFNRINSWAEDNKESWKNFVFQCTDHPMDVNLVNNLLDEFVHFGFIELYYLLLWHMAGTMKITEENVGTFIEICLDTDIGRQLEEKIKK